MRARRIPGTATIVEARAEAQSGGPDDGEAWWWEGLGGSEGWDLVLDVHPVDAPPFRVAGRWKMPTRTIPVLMKLGSAARLRPGVVLPVVISGATADDVEIDWKAFKKSGGVKQLDDSESLADTWRNFRDDLRSPAPGATVPTVPRPTAVTHPPIAGVDFEQWIAASVAVVRDKVPRRQHRQFYESMGFPPDHVDEINSGWYDRAKSDPAVREWYVHEHAAAVG